MDESGRTFDFHALRGQAATRLLDAGASPKVVQRAMRHASSELTVGLYASLRHDENRRALNLLSDLAPTGDEPVRATGTDGAICSASSSAFHSAPGRTSQHSPAPTNPAGEARTGLAGPAVVAVEGFEPPTRGL